DAEDGRPDVIGPDRIGEHVRAGELHEQRGVPDPRDGRMRAVGAQLRAVVRDACGWSAARGLTAERVAQETPGAPRQRVAVGGVEVTEPVSDVPGRLGGVGQRGGGRRGGEAEDQDRGEPRAREETRAPPVRHPTAPSLPCRSWRATRYTLAVEQA